MPPHALTLSSSDALLPHLDEAVSIVRYGTGGGNYDLVHDLPRGYMTPAIYEVYVECSIASDPYVAHLCGGDGMVNQPYWTTKI